MTETYEPPTTHVIPAKAGIYLAASKLSKRQHFSGRRQKSTQYDQSPTNHNENSCLRVHARTREATAFLSLSLGIDCAQVTADSTYRLAPPSPKHRANTSNGNQRSNGLR